MQEDGRAIGREGENTERRRATGRNESSREKESNRERRGTKGREGPTGREGEQQGKKERNWDRGVETSSADVARRKLSKIDRGLGRCNADTDTVDDAADNQMADVLRAAGHHRPHDPHQLPTHCPQYSLWMEGEKSGYGSNHEGLLAPKDV